MDFGLSDEQRQLEDSLRRYLEDTLPTSRVRQIMADDRAHDPALWKGLAALGISGIGIPETFGGSGLGLLDAAVVAQTLAWSAAPVPFLASSVMAPIALQSAATPEQQARWLPGLACGETCVGVAANETFSKRETRGVRRENGRIHGSSLFVIDAGAADWFLVATPEQDLARVEATAAGLELEMLRTIDATRSVGELRFEGVEPIEWIGEPGAVGDAITRMLDAGRVILAADLLGACDRAISMAVEYAKQRVQFGRVIGSFQAVKHMCAEMSAAIEPARSLVWYAAHAFDTRPEEAAQMACHAKAHLAEIGTAIVKTATEVHGGIGFTDEFDLHLWFKRVGLDRQLLGGPAALRERAAVLQGWASA